jgi:cytidylate kinase
MGIEYTQIRKWPAGGASPSEQRRKRRPAIDRIDFLRERRPAMRSRDELVNRQIHRWELNIEAMKAEEAEKLRNARDASRMAEDHPPICLSRDLGAGARAIARILCERTGYVLFGKDILDCLARDMNVQRQLIDSLDEHCRGGLELMLETCLRGREIDNSEYFASLARVINTLAIRGGVVLLGRGASFILRERSALNVYVTAPLERRIEQVAKYDDVHPETARRTIEHNDSARRGFIHKLFNADLASPETCDLVVNTARIEPDAAADLILAALAARGWPLDRLRMPVLA